ncbi:MAG: flagellar protein FlgN [Caldicoprobacterales bacterium]|jgi:flagellar biosynthesis/type III secretory pathway chaperone|nr:flagellar protein FlgN [Clostridiales bacterium]
MEKLLTDILDSMEREKEIYNQLIELSTRKTHIILKKKVDVLDKLVNLEQEMIEHIKKQELERQELVDKVARLKNVEPDEVNLSSLIDWSQGDIRLRAENLQEEFIRIIERQSHLNDINAKLIKSNLEYIDFALSLMTGEGASGSIYKKEGKVSKGGQGRSIFDTKA